MEIDTEFTKSSSNDNDRVAKKYNIKLCVREYTICTGLDISVAGYPAPEQS